MIYFRRIFKLTNFALHFLNTCAMLNKLKRLLTIYSIFLRNVGIVIIDSILKITLPTPRVENNNLGIVRLDDIGDFVTWLPAAKQLRSHFSKQKIILIANKSWASLANTIPFWDEVYSVDVSKLKRNFSYRRSIFKDVRNLKISTIIQPTYICCLVTGDSIARMANATVRIGSAGDNTSKRGLQKKIANQWYTRLITAIPGNLNVLERNIEFTFGLTGINSENASFYIPEIQIEIGHLIPTKSYFLVFPASNGSYKMWPRERFASISRSLAIRTGYIPVICGTRSEFELCKWISDQIEGSINLAGKTNLLEAVELIRKAKFVLSNDSGSIHIAAATKTISFCILGGGHFGLFLPYPENSGGVLPQTIYYKMPCYGCGWRCHFETKNGLPFPCILNISEESVLNFINQNLPEAF